MDPEGWQCGLAYSLEELAVSLRYSVGQVRNDEWDKQRSRSPRVSDGNRTR